MANSLADGTSKQHWMPRFQRTLDKSLVAAGISDVFSGSDRIIHNPYQSTPTGADGAAATAYSVADYTLTDDTLTVNRRATVAEHIDNIEQLQTKYDLAMARAERHAYKVKDLIDQYVFQTVAGASTLQVDDGEIGGTDGSAIALSSSNVDDVFNAALEALQTANASTDKGLFAVLRPKDISKLRSFTMNNGFTTADAAIKNGKVGEFMCFDIYMSNNIYVASSTAHAIFGVKGAIQLALPSDGAEFEKKAVTLKHGREVVSSQIYNATVWNNALSEIVDVLIAE